MLRIYIFGNEFPRYSHCIPAQPPPPTSLSLDFALPHGQHSQKIHETETVFCRASR